jgi:hypothetical protein
MWIWFKCDWWKWLTIWKTWRIKNFNSPRNQNWFKWWMWKCLRFNSCQVWIWFKCDWWKWITTWKTFCSKNFNIPWNQDWLNWWSQKCVRFNLCQEWIWFKYNRFKWRMFPAPPLSWSRPVQNDNWVRNPDTQNLSITQYTMWNSIDWAISYNNSTFIQFCRVWITNCLSRSERERERLQHESEVSLNGSEWSSILRENLWMVQKDEVLIVVCKIEGKVWQIEGSEGWKMNILRSFNNRTEYFVSWMRFSIYFLPKLQIVSPCVEDIPQTSFCIFWHDIVKDDTLRTFIKEGIFYKSSPSYMNNPWSSINPQAHLDINRLSSRGG